tara:strand:+ start:119 stop:910 length:792 start_codon:yes stop_codon:yes gene_type:complete
VFPHLNDFSDSPFAAIKSDFDRVFRSLLRGDDTTHTDSFVRIHSGLPHPIANLVIARSIKNATLMSEAIAPLRSDDHPAGVACLEVIGRDIEAVLTDSGFQLVEQLTAMGISLEELATSPPRSGLSLREVEGNEHDEWVNVMSEGYELPRAFVDRIGPGVVSSIAAPGEQWRYFIADLDGTPAGTATLVIRDGVVGVYNISTLPSHRGRGIGAFVTSEPLVLARADGYRTAILQSSEMGLPVYKRIGFSSFGTFPFYVRSPIE